MPSQTSQALILVLIDFHLPVQALPFEKWQHLKDFARSALSRNKHKPYFTDLGPRSVDGRSVGYVILRSNEDAGLVYHKMLDLSETYGARVHWYDTTKSKDLIACNCPHGHERKGPYSYRNYADLVEASEKCQRMATPGSIPYSQPPGCTQSGAPFSPICLLTTQMANLAVDTFPYPHHIQQYPPTLSSHPGYPTTTSHYALQSLPTTYNQYPEYSTMYMVGSQGHADQVNMMTSYAQYPRHSTAYGIPHQVTATATQGSASASASYAINASGELVNTTLGYIRTERNTLILTNLSPHTTEKDLRKEVDKIHPPVEMKINNSPRIKKKTISAKLTFNSYKEAMAVKAYFEHRTRHIRNYEVVVKLGKDSAPPPSPMVVSSTGAN